MKELGALILILLGAALVIFVAAIYSGFVLSILWAWFIVPLGMMKIGVAQGIGISLTLNMLLGIRGLYATAEQKKEMFWTAMLMPLLSLLFGYITIQFM